MLDCISGGRLIAGFPVGTPMDTNFCMGQIPALTRDKYAEAHDLIIQAWTRESPFAFDGKYNQLRYVNTWPLPIQKPHADIHPGAADRAWIMPRHDYNTATCVLRVQSRHGAARGFGSGGPKRRDATENPYRASFARSCRRRTEPRPRSSTRHSSTSQQRSRHPASTIARVPPREHHQGRN